MAELIWKGKYNAEKQQMIDKQNLSGNSITCFPQFHTDEFFGRDTAEGETFPGAKWYNRLIHGDKCNVLPALLPEFAGKVNLIYIDPPFMTGRTFTSGSELAYSDKWHNNLDAYLQWLYETFADLFPLLAQDGSLYVHLDWRVTHYARIILDEIFGSGRDTKGAGFKSEIIWHYQSGGRSLKTYARKHDTILLYAKSGQYCFHPERIGERRGSQKRNHMRKRIDTDGHVYWTIRSAGRIYTYDEDQLMTPSDVWSDISHLHQKDPQRNGYATQKPAALLERIILASSEENDLILDCFCGSGVAPAVAERVGRRWIACDQSELAIRLTRERLLTSERIYPFVLQHLPESTVQQALSDSYGIIQQVNNPPTQ
jgi:site-specific DNA-methyltransferase (adenine-specific)/adenine-specific DNA-methyltransferase